MTKSVVEMTLRDIPAQVLHPQPGEQLAHSKCSLNSSSSSDKHPWPPGRSRSDEVTRENEKGHQQEGNEFYRAHGPTGCFASEIGYALPLVQWTCQHTSEPRFNLGRAHHGWGNRTETGVSFPTKAGVRTILIGNYGNYSPPITKIGKWLSSHLISAGIRPVKCWLVFRNGTLNQSPYLEMGLLLLISLFAW